MAVLPFIAVVSTFLEGLHLQTGGYKTLWFFVIHMISTESISRARRLLDITSYIRTGLWCCNFKNTRFFLNKSCKWLWIWNKYQQESSSFFSTKRKSKYTFCIVTTTYFYITHRLLWEAFSHPTNIHLHAASHITALYTTRQLPSDRILQVRNAVRMLLADPSGPAV